MAKRKYRVEVNYPKNKKPQYFLVKDVWYKGKKRKVKKYLGTVLPSENDIERFSKEYSYEIELRVAHKKAEFSSVTYESDFIPLDLVIQIEEIRHIYKTFTELLTTNEIEVYERKFEVSYVQGTTSIEGNTFSLEEAYNLLVDGVSPNEKTLREINEIQNFRKVKYYRDKYKGKVTIDFIKMLHSLIMNNIDLDTAGIFRRIDDVAITGCEYNVTPSILIKDELEEIIEEYYQNIANAKFPFEQAVLFHYKLEMIHPFTDGNGRVGREILNYMIKKNEYPRLLFLGKDRDLYIKALQLGNKKNYADMVQIFVNLIISQRNEILRENLRKVVIPPRKTGQMRITEFGI